MALQVLSGAGSEFAEIIVNNENDQGLAHALEGKQPPATSSAGYAPSSAAAARPRGSFGADLTNTAGIVDKNAAAAAVVSRTQQSEPHKPEPPVAGGAMALQVLSGAIWFRGAIVGYENDRALAHALEKHPCTGALAHALAADKLRPAQAERRFDPMPDGREVTSRENTSAAAKVHNVQEVEEYAQDIEEQLFREELVLLPRADYMDMQADLTSKMRMILMDWLIEVHMKYRLRCETLHLTVNLIDRFLTRTPVARKRLQLVGVCAMFIAAKFEEITPPELHDWVYITDKAYTQDEVLGMEVTMLSSLSFQIMVPTAAHFFQIFQKANGCNDMHRSLAQYILELGILDIRMLEYAPSNVVAAALLLSNEVLGFRSRWPVAMVEQSRHTESSLRGCVELLRQLFDADRLGAGGQLQAVHKKFSMKDRHSVATMNFPRLELLPLPA